MDNQHRKITGYRELDQTEIDLMNEVKQLGTVIEPLLDKINKHIADKRLAASIDRDLFNAVENATPERFLALAKTEFQTGLMHATRAVAQPEFF